MTGARIVIGPLEAPILECDGEHIRAIQLVEGVDIVGAELTIDQTVPQLDYGYTSDSAEMIAGPDFDGIMSSDGYLMATDRTYVDLRELPYGTLIQYYQGNALRAKAYIKNVDRVGETVYQINAISAIGLLDTQNHRGNLYRGATFPTVLAEIIGGAVPYTVSAELEHLAVYGWLPYDTKRANLHQLLFACGVTVGRNADGDMDFGFLSNGAATVIPDGHIYAGGSVDYSSPASAVDVTEHSFMELATDEAVTEYDNTDGSETADNTLLVFQNAPLHDLRTTGTLTIVASGVNWAILTGTGILTGKKYTHSTRVMTRYAESASAQRENVVSVTDATLVNVANSENVAERVLAYYSSKKTVKTAIVVDAERPGMLVSGSDPYAEKISGFIASMDSTVSHTTKAMISIITGYIPTQGGNNYTRAVLFTGSGTVNIRQLIEETAGKQTDVVQAVLISGGHGGYRGENGTDGINGSPFDQSIGTPGEGGAGGLPGEGGRVFTRTFHLADLAGDTLSYACGAGGLSDQEGGATTLGEWTSADGEPSAFGVANIFTGELYGTRGVESGTPGGSGSPDGSAVTYRGQSWTPGAKGANASSSGAWGDGGYGGGAAVGANGTSGKDGRTASGGSGSRYGYGGGGGDGATPTIAGDDSAIYGGGGNGGHGGGGAGAGNLGQGNDAAGGTYNVGRNGRGGNGGPGGKGGPGLLAIYV